MSTEIIGIIFFIAVFILIFLGMPIGFTMATAAFFGMVVVIGPTAGLSMLATVPFSVTTDYIMSTVPLFVLMGSIAYISGMFRSSYDAAYKWMGHIPGGMAVGTIVACTGFAACTGHSATSLAVMAYTALPEMEKKGYSQALAAGSIASGTNLGILIPPSIPLIVYALMSEQSVGQLFIAGLVPGLLLAFLFVGVIVIWSKVYPSAAPRGPKISLKKKLSSLYATWPVLALIIIVLGGIWGGVFTPVEAGGIGSAGTFLIALLKKQLTLKKVAESILDAAKITGMIFVMIIGVLMFNYFFALTRLPNHLAEIIASMQIVPIAIVIVIMIFWLIGGCIMDTFGLMMLTLPIFIPIMNELGVNLVWFGILHVITIEAAAITPPMGINVFMICGMATHIQMKTVFKGIVPFLFAIFICLILILIFPEIALFLPNTMIGK
jgi:tripartite ATP-independent transporter DctM subunit